MRYLSLVVLALLVLNPCAGAADKEQKWGTVKGQITLEGDVPAPEEVDFKPDQCPCQKKGAKLYKENWVVNKDNKGIKNVFVWLTAEPDLKTTKPSTLPVHPELAKAKIPADVILDQPCCAFEPHALALREGQTLVVKNSAPFDHNVNYSGKERAKDGKGLTDLGGNYTVAAGAHFDLKGFAPSFGQVGIQCNIHPWMSAVVRVFDHPYYTLTDKDGKFEIPKAPAGEYYLVVWHEGPGYHDRVEVPVPGGKPNILCSKKITIKDDGDTEVNLTYKAPEKK